MNKKLLAIAIAACLVVPMAVQAAQDYGAKFEKITVSAFAPALDSPGIIPAPIVPNELAALVVGHSSHDCSTHAGLLGRSEPAEVGTVARDIAWVWTDTELTVSASDDGGVIRHAYLEVGWVHPDRL